MIIGGVRLPRGHQLVPCPDRARQAGSLRLGAPVRQLHVVGFTSDHAGLILTGRPGAKTGSYVLVVDQQLIDQIERARQVQRGEIDRGPEGSGVGGTRSRVGSALSPREIQARLRSGQSIPEIAAEAGVGTEWVERFAPPVWAEQAAAVEQAGRIPVQTARRGVSDRPLAQAVIRNLSDRGVRMPTDKLTEAWWAQHLVDSDWLVRFSYPYRGRTLHAEWTLDTAAGIVTPRNRLGTDLGFVGPEPDRQAPPEIPARQSSRPRRPPEPGRQSASRGSDPGTRALRGGPPGTGSNGHRGTGEPGRRPVHTEDLSYGEPQLSLPLGIRATHRRFSPGAISDEGRRQAGG